MIFKLEFPVSPCKWCVCKVLHFKGFVSQAAQRVQILAFFQVFIKMLAIINIPIIAKFNCFFHIKYLLGWHCWKGTGGLQKNWKLIILVHKRLCRSRWSEQSFCFLYISTINNDIDLVCLVFTYICNINR